MGNLVKNMRLSKELFDFIEANRLYDNEPKCHVLERLLGLR